VPITAYRDGDYKLMRQLNTGEIKLFNVAQDMGESNDLSKSMPEKTAEMIRRLDAYLKKVGAWTMDEVYKTRLDELRNWIVRHKQDIAEITQLQVSNPEDAALKQRLKKVKASLDKHQATLEKVTSNQRSARWF
jgi:arylsulfatase A